MSRRRRNPAPHYEVAHADHGMHRQILDYVAEVVGPREGFFLESIKIDIGTLDADGRRVLSDRRRGGTIKIPNALYGPDAGDAPVPESVVEYVRRGDRPWSDRLIDMPHRPTDLVQAIGIDKPDGSLFFFTVYGGPLAPQHPDDPNNPNAEEAREWWSQHALSAQRPEIYKGYDVDRGYRALRDIRWSEAALHDILEDLESAARSAERSIHGGNVQGGWVPGVPVFASPNPEAREEERVLRGFIDDVKRLIAYRDSSEPPIVNPLDIPPSYGRVRKRRDNPTHQIRVGDILTIDSHYKRTRKRKATRVTKNFVFVGRGANELKYRRHATKEHDALTEVMTGSTWDIPDSWIVAVNGAPVY